MEKPNRKSIIIFVYLLVIAIGGISGYHFNGTDGFDLQYYAPYSKDLISHVTDNLIPLCAGQMLQFGAVFISAFSIFAYPVSSAVILYRAFVTGSCISSVVNCGNYSQQTLCYLISYCLITLVMIVSAVFIYETISEHAKKETVKNKLLCGSRCIVVFLMTSGAALLIRVIPLIIFM